MRTINKIITKVNTKFGAPMGRHNVGYDKPKDKRIFDCAIPLTEGYDNGGVYWGIGPQLRVMYTKDLQFIKFYRKGDL